MLAACLIFLALGILLIVSLLLWIISGVNAAVSDWWDCDWEDWCDD